MASLTVLCYPDPRLHKVAKPVTQVDARIKKIVADMTDVMYESSGIGLAATQVDIHERIVVIDVSAGVCVCVLVCACVRKPIMCARM